MATFNTRGLYRIWTVTITMRDRLVGGVPKNPDLIESWIKARTKHDDALTQEQSEEAREAMRAQLTEASWNGFMCDDAGLYVRAMNAKALLRECATVLF